METILHSRKVYVDPKHEQVILNLQTEMIGHMEIQGKQDAQKNIPTTEEQYRAYALNTVQSKIQGSIDKNQQIHQPVSGMIIAKKIMDDAKAAIAAIKNSLGEDALKLFKIQNERKNKTPDLKKMQLRKYVHGAIMVLSGIDGYFAFEALRQGAYSLFAACLGAFAIGVSVGFGSHFLGGYIRKAQTRAEAIRRFLIVCVPAFIFFYVLGNLRSASLNTTFDIGLHGSSGGGTSALGITILSFLLFVVALVLSIKYYRTKEERKLEQEYEQISAEEAELMKTMKEKEAKIEAIHNKANEEAALALKEYEFAVAAENNLIAIAKQALDAYKDSNLRYRTDGLCPVFFSNPPKFHFKLFFDSVKEKTK